MWGQGFGPAADLPVGADHISNAAIRGLSLSENALACGVEQVSGTACKTLTHKDSLHAARITIDDSNAHIAAALIESRRLKTHSVENRRMAAVCNSGVLRRLQYPGSHTGAAQTFRNPQYVNGKPAESEFADQAANHLTIGIANVYVEGSKRMVPEVGGVEFLQSASDQIATG
jgi:hypothetical protein